MKIGPFCAAKFFNITYRNFDKFLEKDIDILRNFEQIVQEKYSDRIFSLLEANVGIYSSLNFKATSVSDIMMVITNSLEIMITTDKKLYMYKYESVFGSYAFFHYIGNLHDQAI